MEKIFFQLNEKKKNERVFRGKIWDVGATQRLLSFILFAIYLYHYFILLFYLIRYDNLASLFENFPISLLKWTSTYMFGIED